MVLAKLKLSDISRRLEDNDLKQAVLKIESIMGEAIQMSRSLSVDLIPPVLHKGGLSAGLKWIECRMKKQYNFKVDLCIDTNVKLQRSTLKLYCFFIRHSIHFKPAESPSLRRTGGITALNERDICMASPMID